MSANTGQTEKPEGKAPSGTAHRQVAWGGAPEHERVHDPLLECLYLLTRMHGLPQSREALSAGLPLVDHKLTPSLFERAAKRAGIASKIMKRGLAEIETALLPVVEKNKE